MTALVHPQVSIKFKSNTANNSFQLPDPIGAQQAMNYFAVIFYLLLTSMTTRQSTILTQSKQLTANASQQNQLNIENAAINFSVLPPNAKTVTIQQVQQINQMRAAVREDLQNSLITDRQNAQVLMAQASTNVNIMQQDASENSGWVQTLNTVFQVIDGMSPGNNQ